MNEEIKWLKKWCERQGLTLTLEGECGFGRACVGVLVNDTYPDYYWYDENYESVDNNGEVWTPIRAYHKHPCVAVLGQEEDSIHQLYEWCKWFEENGFTLEISDKENPSQVDYIVGSLKNYRMVKQSISARVV